MFLLTNKIRMLITNIIKMMDLLFRQKHRNGDAFNWRIAPPMVVNPSQSIDIVHKASISARAPERHLCHFKVVVVHSRIIPTVEELRVYRSFSYIPTSWLPETGHTRANIIHNRHKPIAVAFLPHHTKYVVVNRTKNFRIVVQTQRVIQLGHYGQVVYVARVEAAHVAIPQRPGAVRLVWDELFANVRRQIEFDNLKKIRSNSFSFAFASERRDRWCCDRR